MAKSGRKTWIGLLVGFLVLVGLLVAADRGAAWAAEGQIADQVAKKADQNKITMQGEPEVTVEGIPFLTQVIGGEYQAVDIRMKEVSVDGVRLDSLDIRATSVKASLSDLRSGTGEIRAARVTGDATVGFGQVEELVGIDGAKVTGKNGKLLVRAPLKAGPVTITALATADVKVSDGSIAIDVQKVTVADGELPDYAQSVLDTYANSLSRKIPLPKLPYGLKVEGAKVTDAGVAATASAQDVPLSS
ncbi:MAG: LmeA family phospholipid-binding protein [Micromonosporaceae bacterium]